MKAPTCSFLRCAALFHRAVLLAGAVLLTVHAGMAPLAQQTQPSATDPAAPSGGAQSQPSAAPATKVVETFNPARSDEKAIAIVDQVMKAYGVDSFAKTRYLRFTWFVQDGEARRNERTHTWDIQGQRNRLEGKTRDGKQLIATVDFATKTGQASLDGQIQFEADAKRYTDIAYSTLINDSYWLLMPFKLKDPGVRLRYDGELPGGPSVVYDKIQISFDDGIGLTSKDKYWIFVNRSTHMIERWSYVLQGAGAGTSPVAWEWKETADIGGMKFALRKTQAEGETAIVMENVKVLTEVPDQVYTGVEAWAPAN